MSKSLQQIDKRISSIKKDLLKIGDMKPGVISCQHPKNSNNKRGYYQISFTYKTMSKTEYVRPEFVKTLKQQVKAYKLFKCLINEWVGLAIQRSKIGIKQNISKINS